MAKAKIEKTATANDGWKIRGINLIPSDSIYQGIHKEIAKGNFNPAQFCAIAGHRGPIEILTDRKEIIFRNF